MLEENLIHFTRVLRNAGIPVGSDRVLVAMAALDTIGVARREDVKTSLSAVMIMRREHQEVFDAAFDAFWQAPRRGVQMPAQPHSAEGTSVTACSKQISSRLALALRPSLRDEFAKAKTNLETDIRFLFSDRERFHRTHFGAMTSEEFDQAKRLAEHLPPPITMVRNRQHLPVSRQGSLSRIDLRRTLKQSVRRQDLLPPVHTRPKQEWPTLVALLDISGSMDRYARVMLHYLHGLTKRHIPIHTFVFSTKLTNVTQALRQSDPDDALDLITRQIPDWKSGTRIAPCLREYCKHWSRRLSSSNVTLMLITDGLDRDNAGDLPGVAQQLRRTSKQILWLNPLLRFDAYEPLTMGAKALLPHVDHYVPMHNLTSLNELGDFILKPNMKRRRAGY